MTAEGAETSISSLDAHFLKLRRYAELGLIRSLKVASVRKVLPSTVATRLSAGGNRIRNLGPKWRHISGR
jgi:hypothetical protein